MLSRGGERRPGETLPHDSGGARGESALIAISPILTFFPWNVQPYRSRGIGSQSLKHLIDTAAAHTKPKIDAIYLHVQVSNADAKRFYERHSFSEVGLYEGYYKKIVPHDAWILQCDIPPAAPDAQAP